MNLKIRNYNPNTMTYAFSDGSGLLTVELISRLELIRTKAISDGEAGIRDLEEETIAMDKWREDYKALNQPEV